MTDRCRICGCTELQPCMTEDGPCAWLHLEQTMCTNPRCIGEMPMGELKRLHLSAAFDGE